MNVFAFLSKNWLAVGAALAVAAIAMFFQIQLCVADGKYKDVVSQRDAAVVERQQWHDSHIKLQSALKGLEADKKTLQDKLDQYDAAAKIAAAAAARNASEAARVTNLLRDIRETSNDPEFSDRIRSNAIDSLRQWQTEERAASGNRSQ